MLKFGAICIGVLSTLVFFLEKSLPVQESLKFEELPNDVQEWEKKGKSLYEYLDFYLRKLSRWPAEGHREK